MTERTITIVTSDHGTVTIPEPDWCAPGTHDADLPRRSEINHQGQPVNVTVPTYKGDAVLLELVAWRDAFPEPHWPMGDQVHGVAFLAQDDSVSLDTAGLDALADAMHGAARQIHEFANRLALTQPRRGDR